MTDGFYLNSGFVLGLAGTIPLQTVSVPAGFDLFTPDTTIYRHPVTGAFSTNYSETTRKATIAYTGTVYVSLTSGSNNNSGASGQPVRSLTLAVAMANERAAATRIVYESALPGATRKLYTRLNTQARSGQATLNATYNDCWTNTTPTVDILFEPDVAGGVADSLIETLASGTFTTTADANIFKSTSALGDDWFDYTNMDENYCPRPLMRMLTTATDEADAITQINALYALSAGIKDYPTGPTYTAGVVYFHSATSTYYCRLFDNRNPNNVTNIFFGRAATTTGAGIVTAAANRKLFVDGLGFGGGNGAPFQISATNVVQTLDMVRCRFYGGIGAGAIELKNGKILATFKDCHTLAGNLDGLNGHGVAEDTSPWIFRIDCTDHWNGWTASTTNNGNTGHEYVRQVDVNCKAFQNQDRSVHFINNSALWSMAGEASTRRGADGQVQSSAVACGNTTDASKMFLDGFVIRSGINGAPQYEYSVYSGATINYARMSAPTGNVGAGTVQAYTP